MNYASFLELAHKCRLHSSVDTELNPVAVFSSQKAFYLFQDAVPRALQSPLYLPEQQAHTLGPNYRPAPELHRFSRVPTNNVLKRPSYPPIVSFYEPDPF